MVATDPTEAFSTAQSVYIHSSLIAMTDRVPLQRHLGKSEVVCLDSDTGEQVAGGLNLALRWVSQRRGWFRFDFMTKVRHTVIRSAEYNGIRKILFIVSHRLSDNFIVAKYLVDDIWRTGTISQRNLSVHVHKQNREQLKRVLLRKGFALTPDTVSEMVIRIPSGAQHSRYETVSSLRQALLVSYIPQRARVCGHALATVRVVKLADRTLGSMLIPC